MTGDAHCGGKRSDEPAEVVMFCGGKRSDEPAEVVMFCGGKRGDEPAEVVMFYTGTEDSAITRQSVFYPKIKKGVRKLPFSTYFTNIVYLYSASATFSSSASPPIPG